MTKSEQDLLNSLQERMGESVQIKPAHLGKASILTATESVRDIVRIMLETDPGAGISAITGLDLGEKIGIMYHFRVYQQLITLVTDVSKSNPRIQSITDMMPGANFHEREIYDLFGVTIVGHPSPGRLVLPETWPADLFPLRKDAKIDNITIPNETSKDKIASPQSDIEGTMVNLVVGPQHPALLEPEKFSLKVEGEIVRAVEPRIGYVHRGIEKAAETRTYLQDVFLVERICGICNSCHATCFVEAVEKILGTQVPSRGKYLRTIILELNRLHSHLLLLGHAGLEIGYETLFQYMWRDREPIMDLMELITGNRVVASSIAVGGVRRDLKDTDMSRIRVELEKLRKRMDFYQNLYENEPSLKMRTRNVGKLSKEDALKLSVVGPVARASGVSMDVRKDEPYEAYGEIPFKLITRNEGDTYARLLVRLDEITESINIIEYALDHLPTGPFRTRAPRVVPAGEALNRVEAPRGELLHYVRSNGTAYPERVKVRTPTFANLPSFLKTAIGGAIADVPANFVSLDPCFSCTDR